MLVASEDQYRFMRLLVASGESTVELQVGQLLTQTALVLAVAVVAGLEYSRQMCP